MSRAADDHLSDLGHLLVERLNQARDEVANQSGDSFEAGRYRAYREVIAMMILQAKAFDLPKSALSLEKVDLNDDLGW